MHPDDAPLPDQNGDVATLAQLAMVWHLEGDHDRADFLLDAAMQLPWHWYHALDSDDDLAPAGQLAQAAVTCGRQDIYHNIVQRYGLLCKQAPTMALSLATATDMAERTF